MTTWIPLTAALIAAYLISDIFHFGMRRLATVVGLTDQPDGIRRLHSSAVPKGSGFTLFLACGCVLLAFWYLTPIQERGALIGNLHNMALPLYLVLAMLLGTLDDQVELSGGVKLAGQTLLVFLLSVNGFLVESISLFGQEWSLGFFALPFTMFWMLGAINALNLLDGIDGSAGVTSLLIASGIAAMAAFGGSPGILVFAIVICGAILGFLRNNHPPARIYLGDGGVLLLAFGLGALTIRVTTSESGSMHLIPAIALWFIPIFDCSISFLRRKLTGRGIFRGSDRAHLHHRLLLHCGSNVQAIIVLAIAQAACCIGAVIGMARGSDSIAVIAITLITLSFIIPNIFGQKELCFLAVRLRRLALRRISPGSKNATSETFQVQGNQDWREIWDELLPVAQRLAFDEITLDLHMPQRHEEFVGRWTNPAADGKSHVQTVDVPLFAASQLSGKLQVVVQVDAHPNSVSEGIQAVLEVADLCARLLHDSLGLESHMTETVSDQLETPEEMAVTESHGFLQTV